VLHFQQRSRNTCYRHLSSTVEVSSTDESIDELDAALESILNGVTNSVADDSDSSLKSKHKIPKEFVEQVSFVHFLIGVKNLIYGLTLDYRKI